MYFGLQVGNDSLVFVNGEDIVLLNKQNHHRANNDDNEGDIEPRRYVQAALQRWFVVLFTHISNVLYFNSFYALFQQVGPQTTGAFNGHVVAPFVNFCLMPRQ